ncbi:MULTISPECIES: ATP-binding SpoIIE family protein phosphatase [Streptomyces]|uniref:ATP-binding SpoIIE family protein phosphatase n=1 Tax=Streptomyces TaxID=1883 RepID=UPI001162908B|nr:MULTISPECIES: ATP-binding SpoIIE family protein phosphatase [Streptomyces]MCX5351718.1 SpoIIE family protein phosphatase [Streptomyces mirabilis]QDN80207.1 SpoIIE family protein phosphatase [Streptomyces sp. S1A1-7]QDO00525.1 SpoIIE family protein phosphatase [Streptomyces sp. RLB1-9]QDO22255.1 SpoIIE family protein phosphatase [Streptomyces sp. S1A1-8]QDO32381.1 SpoIIE family protein phosphatase [Streptomyces sp. S1A1-3]
MDSTRVTEHPTSHERRQSGAGRPSTPADPRGALLRTPEPQRAPGALPAQPARTGDAPTGSAPSTPYGRHGSSATQASASTDTPSPSGTGASTPSPASPGPEHSQPSASEPDAHRPRPAPEGIPAQPGTEGDRPSGNSTGTDRRTGQGLPHAGPMPMRRDGDRLRFVGAATRRIARGIDLDEIVMGLCRATVPTFSDAILVYLRDPLPVGDERPTGPLVLRLRRTDRIPEERDTENGFMPALRPEPNELSAMTAELCEVRPGGALAEVLRGVRPVFADAPAARAALPELLGDELIVPTGQRAILAPLRGRRRVIGAALFVRRPERMAFETDDLLVAAQLATHSALGIDKAVLYGREAYIADELQRTMLPETLPRPTGVRLASRYLPAAETARVGGDWYDAIPLPGSRVALVVGDVMGHSMTSAAIMGQLRTTAQTLAGLDLPPQEVLHHLDEQAQRLGTDRMATCLYAVYDPVAHRITIANAGHPPPVLLHLGGRAEVLRVPPGAPIGVGGVDFEAVELDAPAGATLLLYTDGLVESRLRDVWTGIEQLREKLAATAQLTGPDHPPPLEALCDEVLDMLGPGDRDDDIALLAARFDGIAPSDVAYWHLEPEDAAPGRARRLARRALSRWGMEDMSDSVELLVSEVVTNAVRYASRPVTLRLLRTDVLRCEVGDDVPQLPRLRQARATDEGGRGLYLVNKLARRWGATRLSTGKVVWFELSRG